MNLAKVNTLTLNSLGYPDILAEIPQPPKQLFYIGSEPKNWLDGPKVAVVGSRKISAYGRQVTSSLATDLTRAGVVIISGLAFGVDSVAHSTSIEAGGLTVAILPTPVEQIYPTSHLNLARQIVEQGGTLISEYPAAAEIYKTNFVARNRIVSGLADVLLITEAGINSGTMQTAKFALDQGKTVMAVPGNITSPGSEGTNNLIKTGATPVSCVDDVFFALNLKPKAKKTAKVFRGSEVEQTIFDLIASGVQDQEELAVASQLDSPIINSALTMLEIGGYIKPRGAGNWTAI